MGGIVGYVFLGCGQMWKVIFGGDVYSFGVVLLEILMGKFLVLSGGYIVWEVCSQIDRLGMEGVREMLDLVLVDMFQDELEIFLIIVLLCVEDIFLE